ncbi:Caspase domain-containing protein, partial [Candidatus Electrothrix marina]
MPGRFLYILFVLSVAVPVQASSPYGRFHALVIGNQNYKYLTPLKTPLADAEAVAEVLQNRYGFEVELVLDGDRKEIMRAFSTLRKTMTSEKDNLLIYYAGHGYLDRLSGVGYWQPVDAEQDNDIDWIPTSRVTNLLKVIQARHALIVADSCYSG